MKAATQNLTAQMPLPSSTHNLPSKLSEVDVNKICQLIVQQLAALLPTVAVWTVYYNLDTGKRQLVAECMQEQMASAHAIPYLRTGYFGSEHHLNSYLQQEKWLLEDLPFLEIVEFKVTQEYYVYVCCVGEQSVGTAEYILICTAEILSPGQQQSLLGNAQLLSQYLVMYKERSRHITEIASLSQALGRTEHQLRNPLALINLYAENLRLALPSGCLQEQATLIRQTVDRLSAKLTDLLYYGQRARLQIGQHNLQTIVAESIQGLQPWLEQKKLQIHYPDKPVHVTVDSWQIKQVFDNLLANAVHFSPDGGTVNCNWHVYNHEVLVEICDRGSGISQEDLTQIFKPYYSRRLGGTGLGLAIAQKIILDHQGNLWADNIPEGGAQFSFTLPIKR
ncbi:histidine kinase [Nostoc minutum NIES-26]|uniref:histidine kinase n=1 Tax=Nostoc minutum NIES-26 TaxID=1844469 RepID=A0A367R7T0_9NOSO|nr:HAMP domain-containing sensor histidine kinase [Dendronalium sp. ChiSLP03b]MDZ8204170.1 HAMP domain-containing sensor histidine kinase [Dendronalium sp. ChiSLP03b]RCJ31584.1 histidine kinase [Nostoc minutum NIES-26]